MRYGIIDIGSNTIRGVVYQVRGRMAAKIEDKLVRSHMLNETVDSKLSDDGISRLIAVLNKFKYMMKDSQCQLIRCFATASLRELDNKEDIIAIVREAVGITINVLSGNEEADYDFYAMRRSVAEEYVIGIDLGGGSCQLFQFDKEKILSSDSLKIGSNRLKLEFVKGNLPTHQEREKISLFVKREIAHIKNIFGTKYAYAMGGTAKTALKLFNKLNNQADNNYISVENLDSLCRLSEENPEKIFKIFTSLAKSRADVIIPGIIILRSICSALEIDGIFILSSSICDGYFSKMMRERN